MQTATITAQPQTMIRLRGSVYPVSELAEAICAERGISCVAKPGPNGEVALWVAGCCQHSIDALRRLFLWEDYAVATLSQPDDTGSIVVIKQAPPRSKLRLHMPE